MNIKRPWIVATTTLALAGFGGAMAVAGDDVQLNDREPASVVQMSGSEVADAATALRADASPESADSPAESPFESANSGSDSPGDVGHPAPPAAHWSAASAQSPAPAPRQHFSADSAGSPVQRQAPHHTAGSADSGNSAGSGSSADSAG